MRQCPTTSRALARCHPAAGHNGRNLTCPASASNTSPYTERPLIRHSTRSPTATQSSLTTKPLDRRVDQPFRNSRSGLSVRGTAPSVPTPPDGGRSATCPDQQRPPESPARLLTQAERKPPSAGRAADRRLVVCTRSSDVGSADRVGASRLRGSRPAWWSLRCTFGSASAGAEPLLTRLQLARSRLAPDRPSRARSAATGLAMS